MLVRWGREGFMGVWGDGSGTGDGGFEPMVTRNLVKGMG